MTHGERARKETTRRQIKRVLLTAEGDWERTFLRGQLASLERELAEGNAPSGSDTSPPIEMMES